MLFRIGSRTTYLLLFVVDGRGRGGNTQRLQKKKNNMTEYTLKNVVKFFFLSRMCHISVNVYT